MVRTLLELGFWTCACLLAYVYVGYPALLAVLARMRGRPWHTDESYRSRVSVLVCAYNEAAVVEERIVNLLRQDYPAQLTEVIFGSDASTDGTDEIIRSYSKKGIRLARQEPRGGKSALLNRLAEMASGEVLVFTDANTLFESDAIAKLVRHFADPEIGCVSGYQGYRDENDAVGASEGLYWRYEMRLREWESRVGSMVGADGAVFALRRNLYRRLLPEDINDDVLPMHVVLCGYRVVYDPEARAWEKTSGSFEGEFRRKKRIANRGWGALWRMRQVMNPFRAGLFAWQVISHRLLRWLSGYFAAACFACSLGLVFYQPWYLLTLVPQGLFYALAFCGYASPTLRKLALFRLPYYFCGVHAAAMAGVAQALSGKKQVLWNPERHKVPQPIRE